MTSANVSGETPTNTNSPNGGWRNDAKNKQRSKAAPRKDTTKKFAGHDKGSMEGVVITENGGLQQFNDFKERLETVGGSQYHPKVGKSIQELKTLSAVDFVSRIKPPDASEYTDKDGNINTKLRSTLEGFYELRLKEAAKEFTKYDVDMAKVYSLALGQVDTGMKESLKSRSEWENIDAESDVVGLLTLIRDLCYQGTRTKVHPPTNMLRAIRKLVCTRQRDMNHAEYAKATTDAYEVLKSLGGTLANAALVKYELEHHADEYAIKSVEDYNKATPEQRESVNEGVMRTFIATIMVEGSDEESSSLRRTLSEQYCLGHNQYPRSTTRAIEMLGEFKAKPRKAVPKPKSTRPAATGPAKTQKEEEVGTSFTTKGKELTGHQVLMKAVEDDEDFGDVSKYHSFFMLAEPGQSLETDDNPDDGDTHTTAHSEDNWDYWEQHDMRQNVDGHSDTVEFTTPNTESADGGKTAGVDSNVGSQDSKTAGVEHKEMEIPKEVSVPHKDVQLSHRRRISGLDLAYDTAQGYRFGITEAFYYSQNAVLLAHHHRGKVNPNWILLDSESSVNLITNPDMVNNIRKADDDRFITIHCNAGVARTDLWAELPGFGTVWFYEEGIANVLSLALVTDRYKVSMDSAVDNALHVHKPDGTTRRFARSECNLYYTDLTEESGSLFTITTEAGNKENFSDLDRRRAEKARKLQEHVGFPTSKELIKILDGKLWQNCGITRRDVQLAEAIYGNNTAVVQGRSIRQTNKHVREDKLPVPQEVLNRYGENVTVHVDIFTVNGIRFFHSISRHIQFRTVRVITDATQATLMECVKSIIGIYASRGFRVTQVFGDNQFECLRDALVSNLGHPIELHCVPAGQHEPTVERSIRAVKDGCRCLYNHVPFKRLPRRCIVELVNTSVFWLNCRTMGASKHHSARELLTGIALDVDRDTKHQFMEPVLAHVDDTDNTMSPRATICLYLRPTGNATGGFLAYNPDTGRVIHRRRASTTHLTQDIIDRVSEIAEQQRVAEGVNFGDGEGNVVISELNTPDDDDDPYVDDESSVDTHLTGVIVGDEEDMNPGEDAMATIEEPLPDVTHENDTGTDAPAQDGQADTNDEAAGAGDDDNTSEVDIDSTDTPTNTDTEKAPARRAGLRPVVQRTHNKFGAVDGFTPSTHTRSLFTHGYHAAAKKIESDYNAIILATAAIEQYNNLDASQVTQQYGVKKGIKLFGEAGVNAVLKELKQFHDMGVGEVVNHKALDKETIRKALPYLMFLKRKRCGKIKGRGCADGRRQREFITKEESFSPTVSLHALMLSCLQDAIEGRDVATADIPGAFLQTDMPDGEDVYIRMDGTMAELLCQVDPKTYRPHLKIGKGGKKVLFTKAKKAIYGTLRAALLFWENLSGKLAEWGFEMNPYDSCTMNKVINGKQCTIVWHVDDLKISHIDPKVVSSILAQLNKTYGKISPLTVTRGKVHDYVGMTIDYSDAGKVKFSMFDYVEDIIQNLPADLKSEAVTPASDHLFKVNDSAVKLSTDKADTFHHYVAKLLFMAKRARPDIQTAVAFLCTRVKAPDVDDWKKLRRVMGYLTETPFLPLVLGSDGSGNAHWHVDAAFAVHEDMRSHTGGNLTFGTGTVLGNSTKQKLNTTSSTEAEVVGVHDNMSFICWVRYFLTAQQQHMTDNGGNSDGSNMYENTVLYQDNTSAIKLEKNGKASSTKRTRHIHIRYFFITDKVKKGEVTIEYCPTDDMIADYFTKPLQGSKFRKFRNTVMGHTDASYLRYSQEYKAAKAARTGS